MVLVVVIWLVVVTVTVVLVVVTVVLVVATVVLAVCVWRRGSHDRLDLGQSPSCCRVLGWVRTCRIQFIRKTRRWWTGKRKADR